MEIIFPTFSDGYGESGDRVSGLCGRMEDVPSIRRAELRISAQAGESGSMSAAASLEGQAKERESSFP